MIHNSRFLLLYIPSLHYRWNLELKKFSLLKSFQTYLSISLSLMAGEGESKLFSNYLVLKPDEGGMRDLFHLLYSRNICRNGRVDCPQGTELNELNRRWLIFVSLLAQVILLHLRKPMSWIGSMLEWWPNLLLDNTNLLTLLLNLLKGDLMVAPLSHTHNCKFFFSFFLEKKVGNVPLQEPIHSSVGQETFPR